MNETVITAALIGLAIIVAIMVIVVILSFIRELIGNKPKKQEPAPAEESDKKAVAPQIIYVPVPQYVAAPAPAPAPAPEAKEEPQAKQEEAVTEQEEEVSGNSVVFETPKTLDEKYAALDKAMRGYYDEISAYAAKQENVKHKKTNKYEDYSIGRARVIRLSVRRGNIVCEYVFPNLGLVTFAAENNMGAAKSGSTSIKVVDQAGVEAAKNNIDYVISSIAEEKKLKKQLAKERRKNA